MENNNYTLEDVRCILDSLVADEDREIREAIAELGYGLDKLTIDPDENVRLVAKLSTIRKCGEDFNELNDILNRLVNHRVKYVSYKTRMAMFKFRASNETPYTIDELEEMITTGDYLERLEVVRSGYGLNRLVNDPDPWVRAEVAKQGYMLELLFDDRDWPVKAAVASMGYRANELIFYPVDEVKAAAYAYLKSQK